MTKEQAELIVIQIIHAMAIRKRSHGYGIGEVNALCMRWKLDWSLKDGILLTTNQQYNIVNNNGMFEYTSSPRT